MECNLPCEKVQLEEYSICSVYFTSESGIAGRAEITGIVMVDSEGLWTLFWNIIISVPFQLE